MLEAWNVAKGRKVQGGRILSQGTVDKQFQMKAKGHSFLGGNNTTPLKYCPLARWMTKAIAKQYKTAVSSTGFKTINNNKKQGLHK